MISIIIPTRNEELFLESAIKSVKQDKGEKEIIVVDGGSTDRTVAIAKRQRVNVIHSQKGRALQMNTGALESKGDILLFLHADNRLPKGWYNAVTKAIQQKHQGGGFLKQFLPPHPLLNVNQWWTNTRSHLFKTFIGDNAMFVTRTTFFSVRGFPKMQLMEDVAFNKNLKKFTLTVIPKHVLISSRKFTKNLLYNLWLLFWIRFLYFLGVSTKKLAKMYYS